MSVSKSLRGLLLAGAGCVSMHPAASYAQAVDYGNLEQVFGEPITTSVTGKPQRASEVPGDLTIITQDDIRRSGADTIPDILQFVTGIDTRKNTFGDTQIGIRGYDTPVNPRLLVLVDGRQVYLDDYGYVAWNDIPVQLDEIRQIEIVRGPASALFGFNAASGVINIITFDPLLDNVNTVTVRGGTQGYGAGDAIATEHFGKTAGVRISVGGLTATGYEQPSGTTDPVSVRYASTNVNAHWQVAPNVLLRAEGGYTDSRTPRFSDDGNIYPTQDKLNFWRVGAGADTAVGTLDLDVYRNQGLLYIYGGTSDNEVYVAKASDLLKINSNNTIRIGLEFRNNAITGQSYGGTVSYANYAADAMWNWLISPQIELTNAVRLDHLALSYDGHLVATPGRTNAIYNNTTITQPSFNSGLVAKVSDLDTIRLTAARGLQVPSLIDLGVQVTEPGVDVVGSPTVMPTSVWNAELAYDRSLNALNAVLTTALFYQRNTNLIASPADTPFTPTGIGYSVETTTQNVGSSNEVGVELGLRGQTAGGFRWNGSYSYASITDDIGSEFTPNPITKYSNGTPMHQVILGAGYTIGKWEMDTQGRWQSSYTDYWAAGFSLKPVQIGNYVTFNARIGYKITKYLTVSGTAEQFNVSRLVETAGDTVDRRFFASASIHF